jgi:hypothetical protein
MSPNPKYKISLYISRANLPAFFATHGWFVVEMDGLNSRWEVGFRSNAASTSWNHLYKDLLPPFKGIGIFPYSHRYLWKGHCLGSIEGNENSVAERMANFITNSNQTYPYRDHYSFIGPNSNTYVQWVLNNFPEFKVRLPANAIGKNYV